MQIEKPRSIFSLRIAGIIFFVFIVLIAAPFIFKSISSAPAVASENARADSAVATEEDASLLDELEKTSDLPAPDLVELPTTDELLVDPAPVKEVSSSEPMAAAEKADHSQSEVTTTSSEPSAVLTSFYGDVKVIGLNGARKAERNQKVLKGEMIEIGTTGEAVLEIEELYILRLKPNTKLTKMEPDQKSVFAGKKRVIHQFALEQGALLGTTKARGDKVDALRLLVKDKKFDIQDSTFRIQASDVTPWIGVLRGSVTSNVEDVTSQKPVIIRALEKIPLADKPGVAPVKVSEEEWGLLRETYEMNVKTAKEEAAQLDLSKKAGSLFEYVFDHGNFYTENVGYTVRDFYEDKSSGTAYLEAEYDVFPSNSFVGLYVLTRDLNVQNFSGIRFDIRRKPDEGYPERFYVEIKSKGEIINRFEITDIKPDWQARQVDFFSPVSKPITEVTLVFLNETIGSVKKGFIQMRNIDMVPLTSEQKAQREEMEKNPEKAKKAARAVLHKPSAKKQTVVTLPKKAKKVALDETEDEVAYQLNTSRKVAKEVTKVVSLEDL